MYLRYRPKPSALSAGSASRSSPRLLHRYPANGTQLIWTMRQLAYLANAEMKALSSPGVEEAFVFGCAGVKTAVGDVSSRVRRT